MSDVLDFADSLIEGMTRPVKPKPWMGACKFVLGTVENLPKIVDECIAAKRFALDLETSGLDNRVFTDDAGRLRTVDHIAGVGVSPDGVTGYYIPLAHMLDTPSGVKEFCEANVPWEDFVREFSRLIKAIEAGQTVAIFHNGKFDQEFLQFNGYQTLGEWDKASYWEDTLILAYMRNTRARVKGLKELSTSPVEPIENSPVGGPGLGMEMIELYELWGHEGEKRNFRYDFTTLDPNRQDVLWYAGSDVICTYRLFNLLYPVVTGPDTDGKAQDKIYTIEKACVAATRWMERNRIHVGIDTVQELITVGQKEWFASIMEVYEEASKLLHRDVMPSKYKMLKDIFVPDDPHNLLDKQLEVAEKKAKDMYQDSLTPIMDDKGFERPPIYDVNSPIQLGTMFDEMGVPGLKRTEKSNQIKTTKDEIDRIVEEAGESFPFMGKVKRFREISHALSAYLRPMLEDIDPEDHTMRINFNAHKVDTGRFSTPASKAGMIGWPPINFQSLPATYDPKRPECMARIRECITTRRPNSFIVAIDYSGVELRLVTNLSREPRWLAEFFHCANCDRSFDTGDGQSTPPPPPARCPNCGSDKIGDLHTLTALSIFGQDAISKPDWKKLRGMAKATNFALCYGGGGSAVQRSTGVDKNEGWRIKNQFDKTYVGLEQWWKQIRKFAKQHSFVRTALNRKYPVPDINNPDGKWASKAERNATNGPIQGSSADITKTAMAFIYRECKQRGWLDKCQMIITMHDELVFEIDADILEEAIHVLVPIMTRNAYVLAKKWPIPLTCDVELGYHWAVPWDLNAMRYREVRFEGNKKIKEPGKPKPADFKDPLDYEKAKEEFPEKHKKWEAMPHSFPEALRDWFKTKTPVSLPMMADAGYVVPVPEPVPEPMQTEPEIPIEEGEPEPPPSLNAVGATLGDPVMEGNAPKSSKGTYTFKLSKPLTLGVLERIAEVIVKCEGKGTATLRLVDMRDGEIPLGKMFPDPILVNPSEFFILARDREV